MAPRHNTPEGAPALPPDDQLRVIRQTFDVEEAIRERNAQMARIEQMKTDWQLLTGETMDSREFSRMQRNWATVNGTYMDTTQFQRLKNNWTLLTRNIDFEQLIRDMSASDLANLKDDYLVLNWAKMSMKDYEQLKKNWLLITDTSVQDGIIKSWLLKCVPYMEYRYMQNDYKVEFTRECLERGADVNGYSLLHMMLPDGLMIHPPLIEVLLSYGADVTHRRRSGETPLEIVRTYYYKNHEDIVKMLQIAEKAAKRTAWLNHPTAATSNDSYMSELNHQLDDKHRCIEAIEPPYLTRMCERFDLVELSDIDDLMIATINYMYVSKIEKTMLKFKQDVDRFGKIEKIHKVFSRMCSRLFNVFDPHFNESINIKFSSDTRLSESAELMFLLEIDPQVEWVSLKIFAVPWDIEYYVSCKASSKSRFSLERNSRNHFSICSENLLCDYEKYLGAYQKKLISF